MENRIESQHRLRAEPEDDDMKEQHISAKASKLSVYLSLILQMVSLACKSHTLCLRFIGVLRSTELDSTDDTSR